MMPQSSLSSSRPPLLSLSFSANVFVLGWCRATPICFDSSSFVDIFLRKLTSRNIGLLGSLFIGFWHSDYPSQAAWIILWFDPLLACMNRWRAHEFIRTFWPRVQHGKSMGSPWIIHGWSTWAERAIKRPTRRLFNKQTIKHKILFRNISDGQCSDWRTL